MNQIIDLKRKRKVLQFFFRVQLLISIILICAGIKYLIKNLKLKEKQNSISRTIALNAKLKFSLSSNTYEENNIYFGEIICEKIELDSFIFEQYSAENLKILPCKFFGGQLGENGNICIIGHNYYDNRFFSNLNKLEIGDIIYLKDLKEKIFKYRVFLKNEIFENDIEKVMSQKYQQELTLCTCTNSKTKRLIIKAQCICFE